MLKPSVFSLKFAQIQWEEPQSLNLVSRTISAINTNFNGCGTSYSIWSDVAEDTVGSSVRIKSE